jgi:hypothetical protein
LDNKEIRRKREEIESQIESENLDFLLIGVLSSTIQEFETQLTELQQICPHVDDAGQKLTTGYCPNCGALIER